MKKIVIGMVLVFPLFTLPAIAGKQDPRQLVEMPSTMRQHMLENMRDHLMAVNEIQMALSSGAFDKAGEIAEKRIGMSSFASHGASHMAAFMPKEMQAIGTKMHRAASQFAVTAQESAVDGDLTRALGGLVQITQQCVACHAAYRVH